MNIDGFTVGEEREIYAGMKIFEIAKIAKTVKHYVWSNLEYSLGVRGAIFHMLCDAHRRRLLVKAANFDPKYCCQHVNGKGRVGDWMRGQPTEVGDSGMTWSMLTTTPYMEMLTNVR